jgi:hypothetical protein
VITDFFSELNWAAVLVAALAWFAFSAIWYSIPPLSQAWARSAGVDTTSDAPPLVTLLIPTFMGYAVTTVVIALLIKAIGSESLTEAVVLGVALGLGFGVVGALVSQLYERKGSFYWLINGVNAVIAYTIVTVILTLWT